MNCSNVEELLPLYVGGDLEEKRATVVTGHVRICSQCARAAQEYRESNQLLQLFEPPQFSDGTYAAIRSHVLGEIERESNSPPLFELLVRPFQPRLRWAISTAVLLAVCVFAYYFVDNRTNEQPNRQPMAEKNGTGDGKTPGQQESLAVQNPPPSPASKDLTVDLNGESDGPRALVSNPRKPRFSQPVRHYQKPSGPSEVQVETAQLPPLPPKTVTPNTSVTSDKTLRLEIQTSDRNIRIIWFSHSSNTEGSPTESSKGI